MRDMISYLMTLIIFTFQFLWQRQLCNATAIARKAREYGKKIDVLFIDLEAQYQATILSHGRIIGSMFRCN